MLGRDEVLRRLMDNKVFVEAEKIDRDEPAFIINKLALLLFFVLAFERDGFPSGTRTLHAVPRGDRKPSAVPASASAGRDEAHDGARRKVVDSETRLRLVIIVDRQRFVEAVEVNQSWSAAVNPESCALGILLISDGDIFPAIARELLVLVWLELVLASVPTKPRLAGYGAEDDLVGPVVNFVPRHLQILSSCYML